MKLKSGRDILALFALSFLAINFCHPRSKNWNIETKLSKEILVNIYYLFSLHLRSSAEDQPSSSPQKTLLPYTVTYSLRPCNTNNFLDQKGLKGFFF